MTPEQYALYLKEKFGEEKTRDGMLIRDMNDKELVRRVIQRYPKDREKVVGIDEYLGEDAPPALPETQVEKNTPPAIKEMVAKGKRDMFGTMAESALRTAAGFVNPALPAVIGAGMSGQNFTGDTVIDSAPSQWIQENVPGAELGKSIGRGIHSVGQLARGDLEGFHQTAEEGREAFPKIAADVASAGATVASAAAPALTGAKGMALAKELGLGPVGQAVAATLTKALESGAIGATLGGTRAGAQGKSAEEIKNQALTSGAISAAIPVAGDLLKGLGGLMQGAGQKIQFSVIKPTQADIQDGFSIDTIKKYDLGGGLKDTHAKTEKLMSELMEELNAKIKAGENVNLQQVFKETADDLLNSSASKAKSFGSNTSIQKAVEQLQDEVGNIVDDAGAIPLTDAQLVKRAAGNMGAWQFGVRDPDATARERVYNVFYTKIKEAIEKSSPEGVKEINKKMSELIPVMNAIIRRIPVAERNNALGLTDIITLTGASLNPNALGPMFINWLTKSGLAGDVLEKAGEATAKGIPSAIGNAARIGAGATSLPD